jgi:hypothetical protein
MITGTPTEAGTYDAAVTASNGTPPDAIEDISIKVDATLAVDPTSGSPGTLVTLSGAGFAPSEKVKVEYSNNGQQTVVCKTTSEVDGTFGCTGDIPSGPAAGVNGYHKIVATEKASGIKAHVRFRLTNG